MTSAPSACRQRVARAGLCASLVLAGCTSSGVDETCEPPEPERVVHGEPDPPDLSAELPRSTFDTDGDGRADGVTVTPEAIVVDRAGGDLVLRGAGLELLSWGDLDGDGHDDLLLRDAGVVRAVDGSAPSDEHRVEEVGEEVPGGLTYVWPDDLDGVPGADVVVPDRGGGSSSVWSGAAILSGEAAGHEPLRLRGLPRALASLRPGGPPETLLLVPDPPAVRFAARPRAVLLFPGARAPAGRAGPRVRRRGRRAPDRASDRPASRLLDRPRPLPVSGARGRRRRAGRRGSRRPPA